MAGDETDPIVINESSTECDGECATGSFNWTLVEDLQEFLRYVPEGDRVELEYFMAVATHNLLGNIAHAVMLYAIDDDGTAFEIAQKAIYDASIELNARFGIIEMEAELTNPTESDPGSESDSDPDLNQ